MKHFGNIWLFTFALLTSTSILISLRPIVGISIILGWCLIGLIWFHKIRKVT